MAARIFLIASLIPQLVTAHFQINYPYWRGNSFLAPASQYTYPCAGIDQSISGNNRTLWPIQGGSLNVDFHHPFTYVFINLGLGSNVSNFNISLTPLPLNETGNGTLCLPQLLLPTGLGVKDGTNASIQISTVGPGGAALYNCADVTFSGNAKVLAGTQCQNDTGVGITPLSQEFNGSTASATISNQSSGTSSPSSSTSKSNAGEILRFNTLLLTGSLAAVLLSTWSIFF